MWVLCVCCVCVCVCNNMILHQLLTKVCNTVYVYVLFYVFGR